MFVNGFVRVRGVKLYSQEKTMDMLGITRPTYYKYVKQGRIHRARIKDHVDGGPDRWAVEESEIKRVKAIIDEGWARGKAKLPRKAARR